MCQQQQFDMSSQIEVLLKNGMPRKLGKSVEKTLRKRAEASAAKMSLNNNNNNSCINCKMCGGCLNPKINFNNPCVCDNSNQLIYPDEDESASNLSSSDESLVDSDTGFRPSRGRKASHGACPMAAMFGSRAIENSESQNQSLKTTTSSVPVPLKPTYQGDILAVVTQLTKKVIYEANEFAYRVQATKTYRVLSKSTQPAHVIAVGILSFVLLAVWPNLLENEEAALRSNEKRSGLALVAYLGAFATHFGAQIWMTFVSGLALYFALPRHTFGLCQQILFPKYFAMNSMLSILTLILFIKVIAGRWEFSSYVQVIALTICAIIEVTVRLYLAPPLLRLMREKHKFEITIGSGQEIGQLEQGDLVKCPHYQGIHKAFRRIHMTVAMGNLTALVCTFLHLHYLASKISVG